jgi:hypothetical protein
MTMAAFATTPAAADCYGGSRFNEPKGFRGITWGTPLSGVKDPMEPVLDPDLDQESDWYRRADDKMMIGDAVLVKLEYEFYHGTLSSVYFRSAASTQSKMITNFSARFGNCFTKLQYEEKYLWIDGSVGQVSLLCYPIVYDCLGFIRSKAANKQKEVDKAAAAVRAKRDF